MTEIGRLVVFDLDKQALYRDGKSEARLMAPARVESVASQTPGGDSPTRMGQSMIDR